MAARVADPTARLRTARMVRTGLVNRLSWRPLGPERRVRRPQHRRPRGPPAPRVLLVPSPGRPATGRSRRRNHARSHRTRSLARRSLPPASHLSPRHRRLSLVPPRRDRTHRPGRGRPGRPGRCQPSRSYPSGILLRRLGSVSPGAIASGSPAGASWRGRPAPQRRHRLLRRRPYGRPHRPLTRRGR